MYDIEKFTLKEMTLCGQSLRKLGSEASSMVEVAQRTTQHLFRSLNTPQLENACALVRFFKTHNYSSLSPELKRYVEKKYGSAPSPATRCLVLLGSAGLKPEWNDINKSVDHRVIPLESQEMIAASPMISHLFNQLGVETAALTRAKPELLVDSEQKHYNVFYVPDAHGSTSIPAQEDFVVPYGIKSVIGYGGILPSGDLFAIILFSRVHISKQTALAFKPFALNTKIAVLPFDGGLIFPQDGKNGKQPG